MFIKFILNKPYKHIIRGVINMFNKFDFDIENIKRDFQIENMQINASDVEMLRKYNNNEITMSDMISSIKKEYSK